jgi:hypothetical protein
VLLIKRHLENSDHPINQLISIFKEAFYNENIVLLEKPDIDP